MELADKFRSMFGAQPAIQVRAPGRVNLLGEHVDYNNGPVLPAAINREVTILAKPINDPLARIFAVDLLQECSFKYSELERYIEKKDSGLPKWARYPAGVAWSLMQSGFEITGIEAAFTSNVPIGAGLSSSAAVEVGFGLLWQTASNLEISSLSLAQICQNAENSFVGVACGLMDQFASACGVANHALYFDTQTLNWQAIPLPGNTTIVIADSGVKRSLTNSAYNHRRLECEEAVQLIHQFRPGIQSLRDVSPIEFAAFSTYLPETIRKRAEHVIKEISRVEFAVTALKRNDPQAFGALMFASHRSLRDLYEVSTSELDQLVDIARSQFGCWGARMTGAGFGGCTVNLVKSETVEDFIHNLEKTYHQATGREAQIYSCNASQGAQADFIL